ncbi:hypothetical protein SAMN05444172_3031 [Burkholderia sp. GAS332]|nr:hypothetical protein SAMN05444172_3031 [Burkholderia sp. GAS332]
MRHRLWLVPPNTGHVQRMRIKRQAFELNVNQIECHAHSWIIRAAMRQSCTFIVLLSLFEVQGSVRFAIGNA